DIPSFDTYDEAADFIGEDIRLAPESGGLAGGEHRDCDVFGAARVVSLSTVYSLDGHDRRLRAHIDRVGRAADATRRRLGSGDVATHRLEMRTGSGDGALVYLTTGERPTCDAYFIHGGIAYNIFITDAPDTALMEEILASF